MYYRRGAKQGAGIFQELVIDNFAGGGGASMGIEAALGRCVDVAINHSRDAVEMHMRNHPHTRHLCEDVFAVNPLDLAAGRSVGLAWFSPDCTHHSRAKGGKPRDKKIRGLAWVVIKYAKTVRPRVIMLENVPEFEDWGPLDERGMPCKRRKGMTFKRWASLLRAEGYEVQHRTLNAADYGVPTHRKRLFLIARCDGRPIVWPEPTHGDPKSEAVQSGRLKPWVAASTVIDWTLPTPSIFLSPEEARVWKVKRPLKEKTMQRIFKGLRRYVLEAKHPFIAPIDFCVRTGHWSNRTGAGSGFRGQKLSEPLGAVCSVNDKGIVAPMISKYFTGVVGTDVREPLSTVTAIDHNALVTGALVGVGGRAGQSPPNAIDEPVRTITAKGDRAIACAYVTRICQNGSNGSNTKGADEPLTTIVSKNEHCLTIPVLTAWHHAKGEESRCKEVTDPLNTVDTQNRHGLVAAHMVKLRGMGGWKDLEKPLDVVCAGAPTFGVVCSYMAHFNHGEKQWNDVREPLRTITSSNHAAQCSAFLLKYYKTAIGQSLKAPLHAATSKARFGLVTIAGEEYQVIDIGLRMLTPRELSLAQGFPGTYVLVGTKENQVAKIGNSVPPKMAEVLVRANLVEQAEPMPARRTRKREAVAA
jgi:DNA (cytosine-5)-methyltransferase 1